MLFGDPPHLRKWLEMGTLQEGSWSPHILLFLPLWSLAAQAWPCGLLSMNVMWQSVGMTFLTLGYTKTLVRCLARLLLLAQSAMAGATSWRQETKGCGQQSGRNRGPQPHNSCGTESSKKKKHMRMHLEAGPLSAEPVDEPATQWLYEWPRGRSIQMSCSQIPDPQKIVVVLSCKFDRGNLAHSSRKTLQGPWYLLNLLVGQWITSFRWWALKNRDFQA